MKTWSVKQIQDMVEPAKEWGEKKTIYASDSHKCLSGIYYSLKGEEPTSQADAESLRRMDVGNMIETNQVKKLKRLGIFIEPPTGIQHRVENKEFGVSGRLDALIISPTECTLEAKKIIGEKAELYKMLEDLKGNMYKGIDQYLKGDVDEDTYLEGRAKILQMEHGAHERNRELNQRLLEPNPANHLMIVEVKSISEWGFKYREMEGRAMEAHEDQALFYLSEMRKIYPNIVARVLYVQIPYQNLLEFDIIYSEQRFQDMAKKWAYIQECIKEEKIPEPAPAVRLNDKSGKWQVNFQADWCNYHIKCTGDPNWKRKAMDTVKALNNGEKQKYDHDIPADKPVKKLKKVAKKKLAKKK